MGYAAFLLLSLLFACNLPTRSTVLGETVSSDSGSSGGAAKLADCQSVGIPSGTPLTSVSGDMTVSIAGQVIDSIDLQGCLSIEASNVTVRRSRIRCPNGLVAIKVNVDAQTTTSTRIEDSEIGPDSGQYVERCIGSSEYALARSKLHNCGIGAFIEGNVLVEESCFRNMYPTKDSGAPVFILWPFGAITVRYSVLDAATLDPKSPGMLESALFAGGSKSQSDQIADVVIDGNWLDGGGWTINANGRWSSFAVQNNLFGRVSSYGPASLALYSAVGTPLTPTWDNNRFSDNGSPVPGP